MKAMNLLIWVCTILVLAGNAGVLRNKYQHYLELPSVERFREYLRIDTSKEENLKHAVEFWIRQSKALSLPYTVHSPAGQPVFVATLEGSDPSLPSIMLNSHMDVVKVDEKEWSHPPFDAFMDENGDIYGRGTQDTKDVGIQYLEAIRRIKKNNITLARTLHVTVMPEMEFIVHGVGGHGSFMPEGSAMDNAHKFINAIMAYRERQKKIRNSKTESTAGYTSLNINLISAANIIPSEMKIVVDMRLATDADPELIQLLVNSWMSEAGNSTTVKYLRRETESGITSVDDTNTYWVTMRDTLTKLGVKFKPVVLPATSDMLVLRNIGIPAIGFCTKINTTPRLHAKDEYQNVETFLKGIDIYTEIIKNLGNTPPEAVKQEYLKNNKEN